MAIARRAEIGHQELLAGALLTGIASSQLGNSVRDSGMVGAGSGGNDEAGRSFCRRCSGTLPHMGEHTPDHFDRRCLAFEEAGRVGRDLQSPLQRLSPRGPTERVRDVVSSRETILYRVRQVTDAASLRSVTESMGLR